MSTKVVLTDVSLQMTFLFMVLFNAGDITSTEERKQEVMIIMELFDKDGNPLVHNEATLLVSVTAGGKTYYSSAGNIHDSVLFKTISPSVMSVFVHASSEDEIRWSAGVAARQTGFAPDTLLTLVVSRLGATQTTHTLGEDNAMFITNPLD